VKFRASAVPAKEGTLFIRSVLGTEQRQPFPARTASTGNHATTRGRRHLSPGWSRRNYLLRHRGRLRSP